MDDGMSMSHAHMRRDQPPSASSAGFRYALQNQIPAQSVEVNMWNGSSASSFVLDGPRLLA
jgi:hypothetical protein